MENISNLEYTILDLLRAGQERYGLEMVSESGGALKRGSIYVTLSRMERKGYIESRQEIVPSVPGMPRRLYRVTGLGQQALSAADAARAAFYGGQHA
ncbi:PadR family transcriptional regulator [Palleronia caenipelagi]|uniref:PadR family transcriptional regulator n=1 Tax=Palleronia caenipelagi TaxID=2489174 RepID=A0A547PIA9_9RHOB|nr:PadR family transcriptional regulator [Palleronia caenipelagi]